MPLHGAVARVVVHVANTGYTLKLHALFKQELMNIKNAASREDLLKLIACKLVVAGAARDHHGFNVEVVQGVGHTMKEHAVVGNDFVGLVELTRPTLRVATTQIPWGQNGLHPHMPEHGLGCKPHLREQALGAAAWKVKNRLGIGRAFYRVTNNGNVVGILDVKERTCRLFGKVARHFLVHKVNNLLAQRGLAQRWRGFGRLPFGQSLKELVAYALGLIAPVHHEGASHLNGLRVGCV